MGERAGRSHDASECYTLDDYRARYALYKSDANLAAAHAACAWLVTWDDHEVDNNYGADFTEENDAPELALARRAAAYQAYYEHMPLPRRAVPYGPFIRLHTIAPSAISCRSLHSISGSTARRSDLADAQRTMLGGRQEGWLYAGLANSRARWNLMAQGTVMSFGEEQQTRGGRPLMSDGWNGFPAARGRLLSHIADRNVRNPVVLSGDVHAFLVGSLLRDDADPASTAVATELTTSSITSQPTPQSYLDARLAGNPRTLVTASAQRGYLRLDITPDRLTADLIAMDDVKNPDSGRSTLRSYVVEAGRPTPVPA